ncbi:T9SS type A sorting domain-containing protein, partial [Polluticaenibacter yanchengensis]|nr:T9SS type A sorting domain-containing protein [Chitinophagaceae bacterium LY-5]
ATYTITWSTVLPIVLNNFYATAITCNKAHLNWHASNAVNFTHFEIEKSVDGMSYVNLATIPYNEMESKYSFYDNQLSNGNTYYRLKLVDRDGTFKYSKIIFITSSCNSKNITVFPNPLTTDVVNITGLNGKVQLELCDISGKIISRQTSSNYQERIDMAGLSSGIYILKVIDKNGRLLQSVRINKLK